MQVQAFSVRRVREATIPYQGDRVRGPADAAKVLHGLLGDYDREAAAVLALDTKHRPIGIHIVSVGTLDGATLHPREVYKFAILCSAAAIMLGHNHPSGDPTPSPDDISVTRRLREAGELLGIRLLDHIIVTGDPAVWTSAAEPR